MAGFAFNSDCNKNKKQKLIILIALFPILFTTLYCLLFKASLIDIGKTLIRYQGLWGIWGFTAGKGVVIKFFWQKLTTLIFLTCFFSYSWFIKERNLIKNILNLLFFIFVLTTNFSIQYFTWIIPFLIFIRPKNYLLLMTLISIYLFTFYYLWIFCQIAKITPDWLIIFQDIAGFIVWLSFIKVGYLSRKIS